MATTPNFGWPTPDDTDLVRDGAAAIRALGDAIDGDAAGFGGLVAVKSAIFTGTQTDSVAGQANLAVTDLEITHALADASNKLIISAFRGAAASSGGTGAVGIAVHDGTGLIAIADADGIRTRVTAGGAVTAGSTDILVTMPSVTFVHTPNTTDSRTYTVRAINIRTETRTLFINRTQEDTNFATQPRAVSSLVVQEVKV